MMPLLYVILKYAKGDLEEATIELSEGNQMQMLDAPHAIGGIQ